MPCNDVEATETNADELKMEFDVQAVKLRADESLSANNNNPER